MTNIIDVYKCLYIFIQKLISVKIISEDCTFPFLKTIVSAYGLNLMILIKEGHCMKGNNNLNLQWRETPKLIVCYCSWKTKKDGFAAHKRYSSSVTIKIEIRMRCGWWTPINVRIFRDNVINKDIFNLIKYIWG